MNRILLAFCLLFCFTGVSFAEEEMDVLTDENGDRMLSEDGTPIYAEYIEMCRNTKTGRYIKCPKEGENQGYIAQKLERRCRNSQTGRFVKCPN